MRRWLEGLETFAIDVILERRYGRRADVLRWILNGLAVVYRLIVQFRLALYRNRYFRPRGLGCLVISVGNLTVGGTILLTAADVMKLGEGGLFNVRVKVMDDDD